MKKLLCITYFVIVFVGCAHYERYQIQDYPTVCIVDRFTLEDTFRKYFNEGHSMTCTKGWLYTKIETELTSFYVKDKDILYSIDNANIIFTQLWLIKNEGYLPQWPFDNRIFQVKKLKGAQ